MAENSEADRFEVIVGCAKRFLRHGNGERDRARCLEDYVIGIDPVTAVWEGKGRSPWGVESALSMRRRGSAGPFVPSCYDLARPTATNLASPRAHNPSFFVVFDNRAGFRIPGRIHIEFKESRR